MSSWNDGSIWLRWEPHIHTPETTQNDGYGAQAWPEFLKAIEDAIPAVSALGVTDYYTLRGYKRVQAHKRAGRMPGVKFVFPNVEMRLDIRTEKAGGVNLHLLFDPEEQDHEEHIERLLRQLKFHCNDQDYFCSDSDLIRLGRDHAGDQLLDDVAALRLGAGQFKVSFDNLRELFNRNAWLGRHCIVGIPNGHDGLSGTKKDDSFSALRREIARFADVIFSSSPRDRDFYLGEGGRYSKAEHIEEFRSLKPCLHGSDAHRLEDVCRPEQDRFCWIKARPTWDGLRQILIEPKERVFIGHSPPRRSRANWIRTVSVNAPWFQSGEMTLNEGVVAIIGPRGSGKTALADLIALAADAYDHGHASFLGKAAEHAHGAVVSLGWADERDQSRCSVGVDTSDPWSGQSVCYLSQQFVEALCSPTAEEDRLLTHIERVIFDHLPDTMKAGAMSFQELRASEAGAAQSEVEDRRHEIEKLTADIAADIAFKETRPQVDAKSAKLSMEINALEKQIQSCVVRGKEEKLQRFSTLSAQFAEAEKRVQEQRRRKNILGELKREFAQSRTRARAEFANRETRLRDIGIAEDQLTNFHQMFSMDLDRLLEEREQIIEENLKSELGGTDNVLKNNTYASLKAEFESLQKELAADSNRERQLAELSRLLQQRKAERENCGQILENIAKAPDRIKAKQARRLELYGEILGYIAQEEAVLRRLYEPMSGPLATAAQGRGKIDFYVHRAIDCDGWAARGEELLDLRVGNFKGSGALLQYARENLVPGWRSGDSEQIRRTMSAFIGELGDPRKLLKRNRTLVEFASWLFATDHIRVGYGIRYDGVDIERLSPGTRGIVLLILYLALDHTDDRPLIVDQPEENLDPRSVYRELVGYFLQARRQRQVIIVTHNANLVVNTDADQVIVAASQRIEGQVLPNFTYMAGALEDREVRRQVCDILEGGEEAFRQRERRYEIASP